MMKKEFMTPQQAWEFIKARSTRKTIGLNISDYIHTFFFCEEKEVVMMTMNTKDGQSLSEMIAENYDELLQECKDAKQVVMQLYCGKDFHLMMDDMNRINYFVEALGDAEFAWGLENVDTEDFLLQVCVFAIK